MTHLTVAIMVDSVDAALADAARAAERGADLVEFRVDRLPDAAAHVAALVERSPLPCILTCRPTWEGGEYEGLDADRAAIFEAAAAASRPPAYIDVELAAYQRDPDFRARVKACVDHPAQVHAKSTGLILSSHDFESRPRDLLQRVEAMAASTACRVMKFAWLARSLRDNVEAFELIDDCHKPTIALCMGEPGLPSRVLSRKFGALLTFAGLTDSTVTAPGQVGVEAMKRLYRWDAIDSQTAVFGVIGWPVGHSMSPAIMNGGFDLVGFNGVYLPLPVPPEYEHFKATVATWLDHAPLDFRGASVTIPHKQNLIRFVEEEGGEIDALAREVGAANTLHRRADGSLLATNTDYAGAIDSVCAAMHIERDALAGRKVALIGAGGAARAVVAAFRHYGADVTIHNRTPDSAQKLAEAFGASAASLNELPKTRAQIAINCTPIGMHPDVDATPLPDWPPELADGAVVFDTVYNPIDTKLLTDARDHGCVAVSGLEMFVRQAAAQFELWTGQPAPVELFEQIVRERLTAKSTEPEAG